jgi:amino-acid N-acetyltransferase
MNIRKAKIQDTAAIHSLINYYAELDRMLFRDLADIYENLQGFVVAESQNKIIGCCLLQVIWADLAEIKSLAVEQNFKGKGIGKKLVDCCLENAKELGVKKVFALTLEPKFFEKTGFKFVDKSELPMKVWSDCAFCPKQDHCDEFAYIKEI